MLEAWWFGLLGGAMIGAASALLLLTHGRIAGISSIVGALFAPDAAWRRAFIAGLLVVGVTVAWLAPAAVGPVGHHPALVVVSGLLVGIGTRMGSGCTSGHGVKT